MSGRPSASRSAMVRSSAAMPPASIIDPSRPLGRARDAVEGHTDVLLAPAGDELVAAVPVDVDPADCVAPGQRLVDHLPRPRSPRRLCRLAIDRHRRAVPRLDHGERACPAEASDLHLAGIDVADARLRPVAVGAALEQVQALAAGGDQLVVAVAVEVEHGEVVDDVQRVVDDLGRPRILAGSLGTRNASSRGPTPFHSGGDVPRPCSGATISSGSPVPSTFAQRMRCSVGSAVMSRSVQLAPASPAARPSGASPRHSCRSASRWRQGPRRGGRRDRCRAAPEKKVGPPRLELGTRSFLKSSCSTN